MNIKDRLYLSTIDENAADLARENGLGLELAEFCMASNLDENLAEWLPVAEKRMKSADRFVFHAPFAELHPAAIDPLARKVAMDRFDQAYQRMSALGVKRMVAHSGFLPYVYYPVWQVSQSVAFWREFLADKPEYFELLLENVLDDTPDMLLEIIEGINDPRAGVCFDVGHAHVSVVSKIPLMQWIETLRPHIRHVHLHDNDASFDLHSPLGEGTIDIPAVLAALPETCTVTLENITAAPSVEWLKKRGYLG